MRALYEFLNKTAVFTIGLITCLISLTFLIEYMENYELALLKFIVLAFIGTTMTIYGLTKLVND